MPQEISNALFFCSRSNLSMQVIGCCHHCRFLSSSARCSARLICYNKTLHTKKLTHLPHFLSQSMHRPGKHLRPVLPTSSFCISKNLLINLSDKGLPACLWIKYWKECSQSHCHRVETSLPPSLVTGYVGAVDGNEAEHLHSFCNRKYFLLQNIFKWLPI